MYESKKCALDLFSLVAIAFFVGGINIPWLRQGWGEYLKKIAKFLHL